MRAISRAVLATHPVIAFALVAARWSAWFMAGHPVGTGLFLAILLLGTAVIWLLPVAVVAEGVCAFIASRYANPIRRQYWLWVQACRFRRRWPSVCTEVGIHSGRELPMVFSTNFYSNPEGLRPILTAPRLSIVPRFESANTVSWSIKPWGAQRFDELKSQVVRIPDADDRIHEVRLEGPRSVRSRWRLVVTFTNSRLEESGQPDRDQPVPSDHGPRWNELPEPAKRSDPLSPNGDATDRWPLPTRPRRGRRHGDRHNRPFSKSPTPRKRHRRPTATKRKSLLAVWSVDSYE